MQDEKDKWVEAVIKRAREGDYLIVTMKYCARCQLYDKLISKTAILNAKARIGDKWYAGFIVFLCSDCAKDPNAEELVKTVQWMTKTGSANLIFP